MVVDQCNIYLGNNATKGEQLRTIAVQYQNAERGEMVEYSVKDRHHRHPTDIDLLWERGAEIYYVQRVKGNDQNKQQ